MGLKYRAKLLVELPTLLIWRIRMTLMQTKDGEHEIIMDVMDKIIKNKSMELESRGYLVHKKYRLRVFDAFRIDADSHNIGKVDSQPHRNTLEQGEVSNIPWKFQQPRSTNQKASGVW